MNVQHHLLGLDGTHPWPAGTLRPPPGYPGHTTRRHPTFYNWALRRLREGDGHLQPGPPQPGPAPFALQEQGSCASTSAAAATRPGPTSGPTGGAGGPRPGRLGTTSALGEVPSVRPSACRVRRPVPHVDPHRVVFCVPRARMPWRRNRTGLSPRFAWPSSARPPTSFLAMFITLALGQRGHVGKAPAVASALTSLSRACSRPCTALP